MFCRLAVFTLAIVISSPGGAFAFLAPDGDASSCFVRHHQQHKQIVLSSAADDNANISAKQDRRDFLVSTGLATLSLLFATPNPALAASSSTVDYKAVSQDIAGLVKANPDWGPTLVRLAWHSSGSYDKISKTGGSGYGTIRFKEELAHGGNAGLGETAVKWLEPVYKKYADQGLSYADLYTLAGGTLSLISFFCQRDSWIHCCDYYAVSPLSPQSLQLLWQLRQSRQ